MGLKPNAIGPLLAGKLRVVGPGAAEASVVAPVLVGADAELAAVVAAWPTLPEALRRAVLAIVGAGAR